MKYTLLQIFLAERRIKLITVSAIAVASFFVYASETETCGQICLFTPQMAHSSQDRAKAGTGARNSVPVSGTGKEHSHLGPHCCLPGSALVESRNQELELGIKPRISQLLGQKCIPLTAYLLIYFIVMTNF